MLSIITPYLSNSKCIDLYKEILRENTNDKNYELVEIVDETDVYFAWNEGVRRAKGDIVILINDDMFVPKNWDIFYTKYAVGKTVVTGYVIEPGVIPVSNKNITIDFGKNPKTYQRDNFENWVNQNTKDIPEAVEGKGWYMPLAMEKKYFVDYPNEIKFPYPNDELLIDNILPSMGYKYLKVNSFCYHLQAFSHNKDADRN
jgi:hypothetical protein